MNIKYLIFALFFAITFIADISFILAGFRGSYLYVYGCLSLFLAIAYGRRTKG